MKSRKRKSLEEELQMKFLRSGLNQHHARALSTLVFDCRRAEYLNPDNFITDTRMLPEAEKILLDTDAAKRCMYSWMTAKSKADECANAIVYWKPFAEALFIDLQEYFSWFNVSLIRAIERELQSKAHQFGTQPYKAWVSS